jgi:hypothetical protein
MKIYSTHLLALSLLLALYGCLSYAFNVEYLPRKFKVYRNEEGIVQQKPEAGFIAKIIPNINLFRNAPGCYLACYSTDVHKGVYPVSSDAYLVGQIRVEGQYQGKVCYPKDITQPFFSDEKSLTELCSKSFKCIGNSCWAGGTTGQWFGLK